MEMTRGYAENGWNVVNIAVNILWSLGYIPQKKTINIISSPLIYFASSFQSEIVFLLWNYGPPSSQGLCWKLYQPIVVWFNPSHEFWGKS